VVAQCRAPGLTPNLVVMVDNAWGSAEMHWRYVRDNQRAQRATAALQRLVRKARREREWWRRVR